MRNTKLFYLMLALCCSGSVFAQGNISSYILFDASCMKQYDYVRSSNYHDIPFWDFHFEVSPHQTYIFRVLKVESYREEISKLDNTPISCQQNRELNNNFVTEINSARKMAYIVMRNSENQGYTLYQVKKIVSYHESDYALMYKDQLRSFTYNFSEINQGKNLDTTGTARVLYENINKTDCAKVRSFKSFDKINPRLSETLHFTEKIGLTKIESENGTLELKSINGEPLATYIAKNCAAKSQAGTDVNNPKNEKIMGGVKTESETGKGEKSDEVLPNPFIKSGMTARGGDSKSSGTTQTAALDANGYYTVQEGDNLYKIAVKFGTKVEAIKALNNLTSNTIDRNQKLKIAGTENYADSNPVLRKDETSGTQTKVHIVHQGECLWDIAKRYGTTTDKLKEINNLDSEKIDIQQEIIIEKIAGK